jgi:hypothetical protein
MGLTVVAVLGRHARRPGSHLLEPGLDSLWRFRTALVLGAALVIVAGVAHIVLISLVGLSPLVTLGAITTLAGGFVALVVFARWVDPLEAARQHPTRADLSDETSVPTARD